MGRPPLNQLAKNGQLMAFEHNGFWQAMDTLRREKLFRNTLGAW